MAGAADEKLSTIVEVPISFQSVIESYESFSLKSPKVRRTDCLKMKARRA